MERQATPAAWTEVLTVQSARPLDSHEKVAVIVRPYVEREWVYQFSSDDPEKITLYRWPNYLCSEINAAATYIRGGEKTDDDQFIPRSSTHLNKVWKRAGMAAKIYLVVPQLSNWSEAATIRSTGARAPGAVVCVNVTTRSLLLETIRYTVQPGENGHYSWPGSLSRYVNSSALRLRAGEKDASSDRFITLSSQSRNRLWVPVDSGLRVSFEYEYPAEIFLQAETVLDNLTRANRAPPPQREQIEQWLVGFSAGRFADIAYPPPGEPVVDVSPLDAHLARIKGLADFILQQVDVPEHYVDSAVAALADYAHSNYRTANWWYRQISFAKKAGVACALLSKFSAPGPRTDQLESVVDYLQEQSNVYDKDALHTGANLADFALVQALWSTAGSYLTRTGEYLDHLAAVSEKISDLCMPVDRTGDSGGEGILADYSFSQHNVKHDGNDCLQLYSGSYGAVLLNSIFQCYSVLSGAFAVRERSVLELARFLAHGIGWQLYAKQWDWHVMGRAISRLPASVRGIVGYIDALVLPPDAEPVPALQALKARIQNGEQPPQEEYLGNRVFWINEYMAHMTPDFACSAKVISTRTLGTETGNGENVKGYFMGAGSYFVSRTGQEYLEIQPCWDWHSVPGTTVEHIENFAWPALQWGNDAWGSHSFAGGVSDGECGLLSFILSRGNVAQAFKTVYALPDRLYALGSGIDASTATYQVATCVNQVFLSGVVWVRYADLRVASLALGESLCATDIVEVWHDGLLYRFPAGLGQRVRVSASRRSGAWREINGGGSEQVVEGNIFTLAVEHENAPEQGYLYEILPGEWGEPAAEEFQSTLTPGQHVIRAPGLLLASINAGSPDVAVNLAGVLDVRTNAPILMIAKVSDDGSQVALTLADASQSLASVTLSMVLEGSGLAYQHEVVLPQGEACGRSVQVDMTLAGEIRFVTRAPR